MRFQMLDNGLYGIQVTHAKLSFLAQRTRTVVVNNEAVVDLVAWEHLVEIVSSLPERAVALHDYVSL